MIYKVVLDDVEIYGKEKDMALLSPSVSIELNTAGSFEFTMPVNHKYYNKPTVLLSTVEVFEDGVSIFYGRVVETEIDFLNRKKVYCEGALAFFNDTIQRPKKYEKVTAYDFLGDLINNHNEQVAENRRFKLGTVNLYDEDETTDENEEDEEDRKLYRELNYETTFDCIQKMCIDAEGGYIFVTRSGSNNYVSWLKKMPYEGGQPIQFALNMLDLKQNFNGGDIKTSILPLGAEVDGKKLTVKSVNSGKDYIDSEAAVELYGRIMEVVEFNEVTKANKLKKKAIEWLEDKQFDVLTIDIDAAELHYLNHDYKAFQVGQNVHCYSEPHGILNREFPLSKITLNLDSGVKKITIGTVPKKQLTEISKARDGTDESDSQGGEPVPEGLFIEKNITKNGTYRASEEDYVDHEGESRTVTGYSVLNVDVIPSYDIYGARKISAKAAETISQNDTVYLGIKDGSYELQLEPAEEGCNLWWTTYIMYTSSISRITTKMMGSMSAVMVNRNLPDDSFPEFKFPNIFIIAKEGYTIGESIPVIYDRWVNRINPTSGIDDTGYENQYCYYAGDHWAPLFVDDIRIIVLCPMYVKEGNGTEDLPYAEPRILYFPIKTDMAIHANSTFGYFDSDITDIVGNDEMICAYEWKYTMSFKYLRLVVTKPNTGETAHLIPETIQFYLKMGWEILGEELIPDDVLDLKLVGRINNKQGNYFILPFGVLNISNQTMTFFSTEDLDTEWQYGYLIGVQSSTHIVLLSQSKQADYHGHVGLFKIEGRKLTLVRKNNTSIVVLCCDGNKVVGMTKDYNHYLGMDLTTSPFTVTMDITPPKFTKRPYYLYVYPQYSVDENGIAFFVLEDIEYITEDTYKTYTYGFLYDIETYGQKCNSKIKLNDPEKENEQTSSYWINDRHEKGYSGVASSDGFVFDGHRLFSLKNDLYAFKAGNGIHGSNKLGFSPQDCIEGETYDYDVLFD